MILNTFDKLLFGFLLLLTFQIPIIADHYLQFVSGYYESTKHQVDGYKANAVLHEYENVYTMIDVLLENSNSAVRFDAEQKLQTMHEYEELKIALDVLTNGNIFEKAWFIFNPVRYDELKKVLDNFKPGMPLNIIDIMYGIVTALFLNMLLFFPIKHFIFKKKTEMPIYP